MVDPVVNDSDANPFSAPEVAIDNRLDKPTKNSRTSSLPPHPNHPAARRDEVHDEETGAHHSKELRPRRRCRCRRGSSCRAPRRWGHRTSRPG